MAYKILIVDDEPEMVQMLSRSLSRNDMKLSLHSVEKRQSRQ